MTKHRNAIKKHASAPTKPSKQELNYEFEENGVVVSTKPAKQELDYEFEENGVVVSKKPATAERRDLAYAPPPAKTRKEGPWNK
jgi:hypothetical protein